VVCDRDDVWWCVCVCVCVTEISYLIPSFSFFFSLLLFRTCIKIRRQLLVAVFQLVKKSSIRESNNMKSSVKTLRAA
jgi:hypothetical protein